VTAAFPVPTSTIHLYGFTAFTAFFPEAAYHDLSELDGNKQTIRQHDGCSSCCSSCLPIYSFKFVSSAASTSSKQSEGTVDSPKWNDGQTSSSCLYTCCLITNQKQPAFGTKTQQQQAAATNPSVQLSLSCDLVQVMSVHTAHCRHTLTQFGSVCGKTQSCSEHNTSHGQGLLLPRQLADS